MDPRGRDDMVEAISELVQRIGLASQRIGHAFADVQQLHPTDFRAVAAIYRAQLGGQQLSAQALARVLDLSPAAITYVIDRLVAAGHVGVTEVTENTIVCMCHCSTFDGTTGERLEGPAPTGLQPVAIAVEGDLIYLT